MISEELNLTKIYENVKEELNKKIVFYGILSEDKQEEMSNFINDEWHKVCEAFLDDCVNDSKLVELKKEISKLNSILNYNTKTDRNFEYCVEILNEKDPEFRDYIYDYSHEFFLECKDCFENFDFKIRELKNSINNLQSKKFVFNRNKKIDNLNNEISDIEKKAGYYKNANEKLTLKEEILSNKEHYDNLIEQYDTLIYNKALGCLKDALNEHLNIAIIKHTSNGCKYTNGVWFKDKILTDLSNNLYDIAMKEVIKLDENYIQDVYNLINNNTKKNHSEEEVLEK